MRYRLLFLLVLAAYATLQQSPLTAEQIKYSGNPILTGSLCVQGPITNLHKIRDLLAKEEVTIKYAEDANWRCSSTDDKAELYINFPEGLESWIEDFIYRQNLGEIYNPGGTAGGSGDYRIAVRPEEILDEQLTPRNLQSVKENIECKMRTRLSDYFDHVNFKLCGAASFQDGLCWEITLLGHTKTSKGFSPAALNNLVSDRYWFRVGAEIWMGYFRHYQDNTGEDIGPRVKIHSSIYESAFARAPTSDQPEDDRYKPIGNFNSATGVREVDEAMGERVASILFSDPMKCREKQ